MMVNTTAFTLLTACSVLDEHDLNTSDHLPIIADFMCEGIHCMMYDTAT